MLPTHSLVHSTTYHPTKHATKENMCQVTPQHTQHTWQAIQKTNLLLQKHNNTHKLVLQIKYNGKKVIPSLGLTLVLSQTPSKVLHKSMGFFPTHLLQISCKAHTSTPL